MESMIQEKAEKSVTVRTGDRKKYFYRCGKRMIDVGCSFLGILMLSPILLMCAAAVYLEDGGPVLYRQERVGKDYRKFFIYKFRSMRTDADQIHEELRRQYGNTEVSFKLKDDEDPRVTKVGRILRRWNLDELPQLFNVLEGDMSLVGPRPLPVYEAEEERKRYGLKYQRRYQVPQGLTCYWQISRRSEVEFGDRMQLDVDYTENCSLGLDLLLIIKTVLYTVAGKSSY